MSFFLFSLLEVTTARSHKDGQSLQNAHAAVLSCHRASGLRYLVKEREELGSFYQHLTNMAVTKFQSLPPQ